jgi:dienelactone hydrolase
MTRDSWYVPSTYHRHAMGRVNQEFAWRGEPIDSWQQQLRARFVERLGSFPAEKVGLDVRELDRREKDEYTLTKIVFTSEPCADVPCYLLVPRSGSPPYPAMICLQGHNSGMHLSIGEARDEADQESIAGDRDFALQAVKHGFVALAVEQRCFGERQETLQEQRSPDTCHDAAMHALMLGRTLLAERVWDVIRAVDYLQSRSEVDPQRICCMGNSGGGLSTFYAACVEFRIRLAVASCCFCTYADSIMSIYHCADNYIPGILSVAEVGDIAGLIAPRGLLVVAGEKDEIFPVRGVRKAFEKAKGIFAAAGCPENCRLVLGSEGHRFYAEPAWPVILDMLASV